MNINFGKAARVSWRFKAPDPNDATLVVDGKVQGTPAVKATSGTVDDTRQNDDGSWTARVTGGTGSTDITVTADVDMLDGADHEKFADFALATVNFLPKPEGEVQSVSDVVVAEE